MWWKKRTDGKFRSSSDRRTYHDISINDKILLQSIGIFQFSDREPGSLYSILSILKRVKVLEEMLIK